MFIFRKYQYNILLETFAFKVPPGLKFLSPTFHTLITHMLSMEDIPRPVQSLSPAQGLEFPEVELSKHLFLYVN